MEPFVVSVTPTDEMYLRAYRIITHFSMKRIRFLNWCVIAFLLYLVCSSLKHCLMNGDYFRLLTDLPYIAFCLWYILSYEKWVAKRSLKAGKKGNSWFYSPATFRFFEDSFEVESSTGSNRYEYDKCWKIVETDKDFFFFLSSQVTHFIPKECCSEQTCSFLHTVAETHKG